MYKYIVNSEIEIKGYTNKKLTETDINELANSLVVVILSEKNREQLRNIYIDVKELIKRNNKIIMIVESSLYDEYKYVYMLMASYNQYNIYKVDDTDIIDEEYISRVEDRHVNREEVEIALGADVISYDVLSETLINIKEAMDNKDVEELIEVMKDNQRSLLEAANTVDYMKYMINKQEEKIENNKNKLEKMEENVESVDREEEIRKELQEEINEHIKNIEEQKEIIAKLEEEIKDVKESYDKKLEDINNKLKAYEKELESKDKEIKHKELETNKKDDILKEKDEFISKLRDELKLMEENKVDEIDNGEKQVKIEEYLKDIEKYKRRVNELESRISNSGPILNKYKEMNTSTIKCKAKSIIYFKEISYVPYINSFVTQVLSIMADLKKLRVKLVIYEYKNNFLSVYKPIDVAGSAEYINNRDTIVNKLEKVVIVEPNQAIIEDILKANYDVIIVYDRLKQDTDIVVGNNVHKYFVINSSNDLKHILQNNKIDKKHIITSVGTDPESISINTIEGYKKMSPGGKMSAYMKLKNVGENTEGIVDIIFNRTKVNSISMRSDN